MLQHDARCNKDCLTSTNRGLTHELRVGDSAGNGLTAYRTSRKVKKKQSSDAKPAALEIFKRLITDATIRGADPANEPCPEPKRKSSA